MHVVMYSSACTRAKHTYKGIYFKFPVTEHFTQSSKVCT